MRNITATKKREFIKWLLNNYQFKSRPSVWILNFLYSYEHLLEKIHFIENACKTPRGIVIATSCVDDIPLRYYKNGTMITDGKKCFHDIRLNREQDIYIELNFKNKYNHEEYCEVLEENPFDEPDTSEFEEQAAHFLDYCLYEFRVDQLKKRIDEAIDVGDKELFMKLTDELSEIEKVEKKFKTVERSCLLK